MKPALGGRIASVQPGSPAEAAGLQAGDSILSINGHVLRDILDYRFHSADEELDIVFSRSPDTVSTVRIERDYEEDLGVDFSAPTFDGIRRCRNHCEFCFVRQMPAGLRKSLYVKDDDYRYSFLFGNFVTLTNLADEDWMRLAEQRLSPLYVSVHATEPKLRAKILGIPGKSDVLTPIGRLGALGVEVHAQVVIVPGLNDGPALEQTARDLAQLPNVSSLGLVPVGITRYHSCGTRAVTTAEAAPIVTWALGLQRDFRRQRGIGWVYPSDEFLLLAGEPAPSARSYDGFPQLANGIGLLRLLLDDWSRAKRRVNAAVWPYRKVTLVCGMLIAPVLRGLAEELAALLKARLEVVPVPNTFFGPAVTVSGLLLAEDVVHALGAQDLGDLVVLPREMFDAEGNQTLDNQTLADIERQLGVRTAVAERLSEVLRL